jgi:predicted metal-dependent hydrolase
MIVPLQLSLFRLPPAEPLSRKHHIQLGARVVAYELRQAAGRRLAMSIDERGLRVGAPRHLPLHAIEAFVRSHAEWVLNKLAEYARRDQPRHLVIRDGAAVPVLGEQVPVRIVAGSNRSHWQADALVLAARSNADLHRLARRALQKRALEHFGVRLQHFADRLGRPAPALALSSARTRWGSCSTKTGIRIHWRLVHLPPAYADYVIAHEMAHLVEMNHSPRFWAVVERLYPEWRTARAELRHRAAELPII